MGTLETETQVDGTASRETCRYWPVKHTPADQLRDTPLSEKTALLCPSWRTGEHVPPGVPQPEEPPPPAPTGLVEAAPPSD